MNNFTFYAPTMFAFGQGEASRVGALVRQFGGSKVLLVAGGGSVKKNGAYDAVAASLKEAGFPWCELWGVQANPRSGKVYEGIDLARTEGVDFLLAIGGGSVIDTAKAIGMGVPYDGDFWDFFTGKAKIEHTLPIGTVLTISAAGSEGSDSCVITQEDGNLKWGCPKTDLIRPKFSVLDPTYTYSLPDYQLACGAVDMLAHLCERYFTNTPDVALTDRLCEAVMKTIVDAAPKALEKAGLTVADMDVVELNEAFAAQAIPCMRTLGLDPAKTNPNGGAMALGHPQGATGAFLTIKALNELRRTGGKYAMVTMCIGGGMGAAGIFECL